MGSLQGMLNLPVIGPYMAARQLNEERGLNELKQATGQMGLLAQIQKQSQEAQLRAGLIGSGGDLEKAMQIAVKTGNIEAVQKLAPAYKEFMENRPLRMPGTSTGASPNPASVQPSSPTQTAPVAGGIDFMAANAEAMGVPSSGDSSSVPVAPSQPAVSGRAAMAQKFIDRANELGQILDANKDRLGGKQHTAVQAEITRLILSAKSINPDAHIQVVNTVDAQGNPVVKIMRVGQEGAPTEAGTFTSPVETKFVNTGAAQTPVPRFGPAAPVPITVTPSAELAASTAIRGQNLVDARSRELANLRRIEPIYHDYVNNPQVKEANDLEAKVKPLADYMIAFTKTGKSVNANDAALAKAYLAVTTSYGNRAYMMDKKELSALPNLGDRLGNMASSFFAGKDLTDQTRKEMFNYITQRYRALDTARQEHRATTVRRGTAQGLSETDIFGASR